MRLKFACLKGDERALKRVCDGIAEMPEVQRTEANPLTGSALIFYDARERAFAEKLGRHGTERSLFRLTQQTAMESSQVRKIAGRGLLAVGVAGVLLPVIPGTPFLLAGAAVLGRRDPMVARGIRLASMARRLIRPFR